MNLAAGGRNHAVLVHVCSAGIESASAVEGDSVAMAGASAVEGDSVAMAGAPAVEGDSVSMEQATALEGDKGSMAGPPAVEGGAQVEGASAVDGQIAGRCSCDPTTISVRLSSVAIWLLYAAILHKAVGARM